MKTVLSLALLVVLISNLTIKGSHQWTEPKDDEYVTLTDHWVLEFQHASRDTFSQNCNRFAVEFNGLTVKEWLPTDYEIHSEKFDLTSRVGQNTINFIGKGIDDGIGQGIDNVKLHRTSFCGYENVIVNGGFEEGHKLGQSVKLFVNSQIPGWLTPDNQIEIGWGRIYNSRWPADTHIAELATYQNTNVYQTFQLDEWQRIEGIL